MTNAKRYLDSIDTIHSIKADYEYELAKLVIDKKDNEGKVILAKPILMHCPRGLNVNIKITYLLYENAELYYCTDAGNRFTKFDFGAEDFITMAYEILKDF